ncbi:MAG: hypothetical protein KBT46_00725 [Ruminococcus sp.]|nr:hypothetical protein [Candidatus Copronaster equi]
MKPLYEPKGKAKEYGDYAINIYTGCPHKCFYCFAPKVLRKDKEKFHSTVEPRKDICNELKKQIEKEHITGKLVHLCFTCDPYPTGYDSSTTREIIKILKDHGNHIQILTKGDGSRDFDLLDENDWYGITLDGTSHSFYKNNLLLADLYSAKQCGIKTWVSFEPVINDGNVLKYIKEVSGFVDKIKIGKLNYYPSNIDWKKFGEKAERLCKELGLDYYIKDSLREEMNK